MTKNPVLLFSLLVLDDEDTTITACSIVTVTVHLTRKNFEDHFLGGEVEEEKDRGDRKYRGKGYNNRVCYLYIYVYACECVFGYCIRSFFFTGCFL